MEVISLQSGSSGNCIFVRSGQTSILVDAGISGRKAETRLSSCGHNIRECDAVILSHEHSDHTCGLGVFHRKFGLPVYATKRTWQATRAKPATGDLGSPNHFVAGGQFQIGSLKVETYRTPHDAVEGVCFVIEDLVDGQRFGVLTDLGHVFRGLSPMLRSLDAVLLESNYDESLLSDGPYPQRLKDRISGRRGHISNDDAAELLEECIEGQLQWVCLGHLSGENNSPEIALDTHQQRHGSRFPIFCADRDGVLQLPHVEAPKFVLQA